MTPKAEKLSMYIPPQEKKELEALFGSRGMTLPEAVNILFYKSLMVDDMPLMRRGPRTFFRT